MRRFASRVGRANGRGDGPATAMAPIAGAMTAKQVQAVADYMDAHR